MSEQPNPEPQKAQSDAAPKPASASQGFDPSRAQAYVPLPGQPPGRGRAVLALAALIAAGVLAGTAIHFRSPSGPPPIAIAAANREKVLTVTDADIGVAATERVRKSAVPLAAAGAIGAVGTMGGGPTAVGTVAPAPTAPPAPVQQAPVASAPGAPGAPVGNPASSPLPVVPPELLAPAASAPQSVLTPQGQAAVRSDGFSIFSMKLIDNMDQDGDVVLVSIDGVPMSYLSLTNAGATLEIPLKKGESHRVTVTATHDGVGGVTLGLQTSAGTIISRNMAVGESDTWTIDYK